eukprot:450217-Amphidinium_carterae.1
MNLILSNQSLHSDRIKMAHVATPCLMNSFSGGLSICLAAIAAHAGSAATTCARTGSANISGGA